MPPTWNPGAITNKTTSTSAACHGNRHHSSRLGKGHYGKAHCPVTTQKRAARQDCPRPAARTGRRRKGNGNERQEHTARDRESKRIREPHGLARPVRLEAAGRRAWCGEAARRISQAMLDPDTDAMKLFATLLGGAHRSSSANRAGNRACSTACA